MEGRPEETPERLAFYDKIDKQHMTPLWRVLGDLVTPEPRSKCEPAVWHFDEIRTAMMEAGGLTTGGFNFDAKIRRQSIDPEDLFHAHIGGMDTLARGLLAAERMIADGALSQAVSARYVGWDTGIGADILSGRLSLADLAEHATANDLRPQPRSGRQEALENLVNRYV